MIVLIVGLGGITKTFRHWPERVLAIALKERGHTVWAIGTRDEMRPAIAAPYEVIEGVEVFRVRPGYWPNRELAYAINQGPRPDVIHLMHPRNVLAAQSSAWAMRRAIPTVYTWLGPFHDEYATIDRERPFEVDPTYQRIVFTRKAMLRQILLEGRPRDALRNYRLHWSLRVATALAPCSEFEANIMQKFGLQQRQEIIPLWIDTPFIEATPHRPPDYSFPRPWLLFVGQMTIRKGYDLAIQAFATVLQSCPEASLLMVSGINQEEQSQAFQLARELGVERRVHFLGYLSDEELINLYRASDAFLFPTRFEGFGLPLLEAMAAGCPVITTNIPVVQEIVRDGENGLLVPYNQAGMLAQATLRVVQDHELRARLVAGGHAVLHGQYSGEYQVERVEELYQYAMEQCGTY